MAANKCPCGSDSLENIDVTPARVTQKRYFIRCKHCGLVILAHGCSTQAGCWLTSSKITRVARWIAEKLRMRQTTSLKVGDHVIR